MNDASVTKEQALSILNRMLGRDPRLAETSLYDSGISFADPVYDTREAIKLAILAIEHLESQP